MLDVRTLLGLLDTNTSRDAKAISSDRSDEKEKTVPRIGLVKMANHQQGCLLVPSVDVSQ